MSLAFNSLFEMPVAELALHGIADMEQLSILYLRCGATSAVPAAAESAFNSLFEMRAL